MSSADILLCCDNSNFNDDLVGFCVTCAGIIYVRPCFSKMERRICFTCARVIVTLAGKTFQHYFVVPKESVREAREALRHLWESNS